jgi:glycosyltransferase involved in cell wall biosynthesis
LLRRLHGYELELVCGPAWREGTAIVQAAPAEPDLPVHVVPVHGRRHPILFWYDIQALARVIRMFGPDLVDADEEPYSLAAVSIRWAAWLARSRAPMCFFTAQNIRKRYPQPFRHWERMMYSRAVAAYACSVEAEEILHAKGYRGKTMVIPLGVRGGDPTTCKSPNATVGFVGRLKLEKGAHLLLEAASRLRPNLDLRVEIVGSGPMERALRKEADSLGIAEAVTFTGAVPPEEVLERISRFDVLVVPSLTTPSWREQFCRVAVEAFAVGTPVLSSQSGSLPSVLGPAAEYFREGDVTDLALQLARLFADPERRRSHIEAGQALVETRFRWERVAEQFDELYREVRA